MTTEVVTTKEPTLEDLHAKVARLSGRADALRHDLEAAREKEGECGARVVTAKEALATGTGSHTDVLKASRALQEAQAGRAHLEEALASVERDHAAADAEHVRRVGEQERQRQDEAAEPLRREFRDRYVAGIVGIATIMDPFADCAAIYRRLRSEYPLASTRGTEPVSINTVAVDLREAMRLDDRTAHHEIIGHFRHLCAGPGGRLMPDVQARLHVKF